MAAVISGDTGIDKVQAGVVAQGDLAANVAGNGPAFRAYATGMTSVNVYTKVALAGESYDTANAFDSATNSRFQPTVAGYYQFNASITFATASYRVIAILYKNGSAVSKGFDLVGYTSFVSDVVYLNGSTDYVELYGYSATAQNTAVTDSSYTYLSGFLARAA